MMKKFFKIATVCSLAISLATANSAYATEPSGSGGSGGSSSGFDTTDLLDNTRQYPICADVLQNSERQYALDIHFDSQLTFHYQAIGDYNPDTLEETFGETGTTYPKGFVSIPGGMTAEQMAATASRVYDETRDGLPNDPDQTVEGAWYGFDGVTNRIVVINRSEGAVNMSATSSSAGDVTPDGLSSNFSFNGKATVNLYLNGDTLVDDDNATGLDDSHLYAWQKRTLDLTDGIIDARIDGAGFGSLYNANEEGNSPHYDENFDSFILDKSAFATGANGDAGGRFSANSETPSSEIPEFNESNGLVQSNCLVSNLYSPVTQSGPSANNSVSLRGYYSTQDGESNVHHHVGYALVYFDLEGDPYDGMDSLLAQGAFQAAGFVDSTYLCAQTAAKVGSITLSFSARD